MRPRHCTRRLFAGIVGTCLLVALTAAVGCSDSPTAETSADRASAQQEPLPSEEELRQRVDGVLRTTLNRHLDVNQHAAWQIIHGILGYGRALQVYDQGQLVPAVDWLLRGGQLRGWDLRPGEKGLEAVLGPGDRAGMGHEDQWLAVLAQLDLEWDDPIVVGGKTYKIGDLVTEAQWDVRDGMEASWTLIGLSTYLPLDARWKAKDGKEWTIERLVAMEAKQDLNASACGGTHRLIGMNMALNRYLAEGGKLEGGWAAAQKVIDQAVAKAKQYQQPDGSFSASYFQRPARSPDIAVRIGTTGHTLEFLMFALTDKQVREPWVTRGVVALCKMLERTKSMPVECGALYHAIHGLQLYRMRRFGGPMPVETVDDTPETDQPAETTTAEQNRSATPAAQTPSQQSIQNVSATDANPAHDQQAALSSNSGTASPSNHSK